MKQYIINEYDLLDLLYIAEKYNALLYNGVDNWEYFDESLEDYQKEYGTFQDIIKEEIKNFKQHE